RLRVVEEIPAGRVPQLPVGPGEAAAIMTGAPLPRGADAVVMVERTHEEDGFVTIDPGEPGRPGMNRLAQGREMRAGEVVLEADVLLITGGVSAGRRDLVPATLAGLGARPVFHKVRVRPGKPVWFGVGPERPARPPALIFGLPGNPVGVVVAFLLFVRPTLTI